MVVAAVIDELDGSLDLVLACLTMAERAAWAACSKKNAADVLKLREVPTHPFFNAIDTLTSTHSLSALLAGCL